MYDWFRKRYFFIAESAEVSLADESTNGFWMVEVRWVKLLNMNKYISNGMHELSPAKKRKKLNTSVTEFVSSCKASIKKPKNSWESCCW